MAPDPGRATEPELIWTEIMQSCQGMYQHLGPTRFEVVARPDTWEALWAWFGEDHRQASIHTMTSRSGGTNFVVGSWFGRLPVRKVDRLPVAWAIQPSLPLMPT